MEMYFFSLFAAKVAIISFEILELNSSGCFCAVPQRQQSQFSLETSTSFPFRFQQRVGLPPSSQQKGFSAMGKATANGNRCGQERAETKRILNISHF